MRLPAILLAAAWILLASGCSKLSTDYGESKGFSGRTSLNGFGALRTAFEQAGFRSRDVSRLSDRVRRTDVIVWTPRSISSVDDSVTGWFDRWLRQGGRTLIYIVPDSGSESDYWFDAARLAPPDQRLEYRKLAARSVNQRIQWRLNRSQVQSNGWFKVKPLQERRFVQELEGPWQDELKSSKATSDKGDSLLHAAEFQLVPFDTEAATQAASGSTVSFGPANGSTGPSSPNWIVNANVSPTDTPIEFVPLISINAENALVGEIRSGQWKDSKIIVVAGGSYLTNYAFSHDANRRLADKIIFESKPASETELVAGFLASDSGSVPVSEREPGAPQTTGMEMLSEWPISIVTMHGLVLGMIVCLMLLPIFGRPKKLRRSEPNDFGHHLDAVAALMQRAGGETYARGRISDYMKRMHGETSGPWVLPDRPSTTRPRSLPTRAGNQLTSRDTSPGSKTLSEPSRSDQADATESSSLQNQDEEIR